MGLACFGTTMSLLPSRMSTNPSAAEYGGWAGRGQGEKWRHSTNGAYSVRDPVHIESTWGFLIPPWSVGNLTTMNVLFVEDFNPAPPPFSSSSGSARCCWRSPARYSVPSAGPRWWWILIDPVSPASQRLLFQCPSSPASRLPPPRVDQIRHDMLSCESTVRSPRCPVSPSVSWSHPAPVSCSHPAPALSYMLQVFILAPLLKFLVGSICSSILTSSPASSPVLVAS